jgi:hypothetical protein
MREARPTTDARERQRRQKGMHRSSQSKKSKTTRFRFPIVGLFGLFVRVRQRNSARMGAPLFLSRVQRRMRRAAEKGIDAGKLCGVRTTEIINGNTLFLSLTLILPLIQNAVDYVHFF